MSFLGWMAMGGGLMLVMALSGPLLERLPISTAIVYLLVGIGLGPLGLQWLNIEVGRGTPWLARFTEVALIISLFIGGLKLREPILAEAWRASYRLAGPVMLLTIAGVAAVAHLGFGLDLPLALLLGAILAPTDPVLASAVSVNDASDKDRLRYALSGEAGLNDGAAFPFVIFALLWLDHAGPGGWIAGWAGHRLLWAIPAALLLGFQAGLWVGRLAIALRRRHRESAAPNDLLALSLIALSYVIAELLGAWGFLAAFAAGVGLRRAEMRASGGHEARPPEATGSESQPHDPGRPAEDQVPVTRDEAKLHRAEVAAGVMVSEILSFGDTAERLLEVALIVLVGACLVNHADLRALPLAFAVFFVIRPLATWACLVRTPTTRAQRALIGWFGIRGIGSLFYLTYAVARVRDGALSDVIDLTVSTVALSIVLHGITSRPLLRRYHESLHRPVPPSE
ncbi:MAG TPA: sodium:proton antiporter [Polyangia bacterium]